MTGFGAVRSAPCTGCGGQVVYRYGNWTCTACGWTTETREGCNRVTQEKCPSCGASVVYNGNYFCAALEPGLCDWALPHPARSPADRSLALVLTGETT